MALSRLHDAVGRVVGGRYRLVAPLGAGASAQVYVADDVRLGRPVAVKMLHPALAADEGFLRRFRTEARAAASLQHPNVVAALDWGEEDVPYLVTELCAGGSLRAVLDTGMRLSPSQALAVALDAAAGLAHAHARGFVHRDIKPANLLLDAGGRVKIGDFGLARALAEASATEPDGALVGTARYASPEQAEGRPVDDRADVYALALVTVEAVTGAVPFTRETTLATLMARLSDDVAVPDALGPLAGAIRGAGRRDPADRPDADELRILLLSAAERLPAPAPLPRIDPVAAATEATGDERTESVPLAAPPPPADDPRIVSVPDEPVEPVGGSTAGDRPARRRRWPLVVVVALLAAAVAAGGTLLATSSGTETFPVPDLVGRQLDDVEVVAAQNGWELDRRKGRRDGTEPGEILATDPAAGVELARGETLTLVVSEGNELTDVPADLVGTPVAEAIAALEAAGLTVSVTERHDEDVAAGLVIDDGDPPARLPTGSEVAVVVSLGPEDRTVPDAGADPVELAGRLEALRLVPEVVEVFDDDVPAGEIVSIDPPSGTAIPRDSTVTITVSKGPELVAVPDIRGLPLADAVARLEAGRLTLGQQCCRADGVVVETDPPSGESVRPGTEVDVFLREG